MICTRKSRAAKPCKHLPYQSLEELTAEQRAGLACCHSHRVPAEKVSALALAVHFLLSSICSTPRQALPDLMLTHNKKHTVILCAGHAARSPWAEGNYNLLEHRVIQWGMYLHGVILRSGEFLLNGQEGKEQEHLLQLGKWNICSANQAQKECRRGQVEHWAPWMTPCDQ